MQSRYTNLFRIFFAFADLFALNVVHLLLLIFMESVIPDDNSRKYLVLFIVNNMLWLVCAYSSGVYLNDGMLNFGQFAKRTFQAFVFFLLGILLFLFLYKFDYSRLFVIVNIGGFGLLLAGSRAMFIALAVLVRDKVHLKRKIVILGYNDLSKKLAKSFRRFRNTVAIEGFFDDDVASGMDGHTLLGPIARCVEYSIENQISEIYSTLSPESNRQIYELAQGAEKNFIRFKFVPDLQIFVNRNIYLDYVEDIPIISLRSEPMQDMAGQIKKRFLDIAISLFVIVFILSWLVPILGIIIKLDSKGPVFFKQPRSGKNNKSFLCYKFRSLRVSEDANNKQMKKDDKARYTGIGLFLRKTSIDELPQFVNVLLGHMSIVGPRPHMLRHTDEYSKIMEEYMIRHFAKPGITGWAQIHGYRGEISQDVHLKKRIEYDIWYMENWNIWLDVQILFMTVGLSIKGDKNAF